MLLFFTTYSQLKKKAGKEELNIKKLEKTKKSNFFIIDRKSLLPE
jgi:predicted GIY-YIG superfamily endonuclease